MIEAYFCFLSLHWGNGVGGLATPETRPPPERKELQCLLWLRFASLVPRAVPIRPQLPQDTDLRRRWRDTKAHGQT